jgi:hypothetical protein
MGTSYQQDDREDTYPSTNEAGLTSRNRTLIAAIRAVAVPPEDP